MKFLSLNQVSQDETCYSTLYKYSTLQKLEYSMKLHATITLDTIFLFFLFLSSKFTFVTDIYITISTHMFPDLFEI